MTKPLQATIAAVILLFLGFLFYIIDLNHVCVTDIGIAYNSRTGDIWVQPTPGWYVTSPFVRVANISLLPMRVQIPSNAKIINQKLVRFRKEGAVEFVKLQGFEYLFGGEQQNIMLGYAYSGRTYPFLEIIEQP